jgi:hypothetical protein
VEWKPAPDIVSDKRQQWIKLGLSEGMNETRVGIKHEAGIDLGDQNPLVARNVCVLVCV